MISDSMGLVASGESGCPARMVPVRGAYPSGRQLTMEISAEIKDINSDDAGVEHR